jgi:hypothetical protein
VPLFYFGPISDKTKEIKDAKVAVTTNQGKLENYEAVVNPITASKQAVHTIVETWKQ